MPRCLAEQPSCIVQQTNQLLATVCELPPPQVKDCDIKIGLFLDETQHIYKALKENTNTRNKPAMINGTTFEEWEEKKHTRRR